MAGLAGSCSAASVSVNVCRGGDRLFVNLGRIIVVVVLMAEEIEIASDWELWEFSSRASVTWPSFLGPWRSATAGVSCCGNRTGGGMAAQMAVLEKLLEAIEAIPFSFLSLAALISGDVGERRPFLLCPCVGIGIGGAAPAAVARIEASDWAGWAICWLVLLLLALLLALAPLKFALTLAVVPLAPLLVSFVVSASAPPSPSANSSPPLPPLPPLPLPRKPL